MLQTLAIKRRWPRRVLRRWLRKPSTWMLLAAVIRFIAAVAGLFHRHD
jgi:hypothetical protein